MITARSSIPAYRWLLPLYLLGAAPLIWWNQHGKIEDRDFGILWNAGASVLRGVSPYPLFEFPYPPPALIVTAPFATIPYLPAFLLWNLLSLAAFYFASRPWLPGRLSLYSVLTPAALSCVILGQTGLFFGALWLCAFRGSALASAALSLKPHVGFLVIPKLLADWRLLFRASMALALLLILGTVLIGYWPDFLARVVLRSRQALGHEWIIWYRLGVTPLIGYGVLGWLMYAGAAIYFLRRNYNVWTAATATFLISPYGFQYDLTVVCLGLVVLMIDQWGKMAPVDRLICCAGFLLPVIVLGGGTWFAPPVLLASLWLQVRLSGPKGASIIHGAKGTTRPA